MSRTSLRMLSLFPLLGLLNCGGGLNDEDLDSIDPNTIASKKAELSVPCGLSYEVGDVPWGPLKIVYYNIRNCHDYTVKRKVDFAGTTDGECHTIHGNSTISDSRIIAGWAAVRGIKSCD